jgi:hypothetical protein
MKGDCFSNNSDLIHPTSQSNHFTFSMRNAIFTANIRFGVLVFPLQNPLNNSLVEADVQKLLLFCLDVGDDESSIYLHSNTSTIITHRHFLFSLLLFFLWPFLIIFFSQSLRKKKKHLKTPYYLLFLKAGK